MPRVVIVVALAVLMTAAPSHASSLRSGDILALTADGVILRIDPVKGSHAVVAAGGLLAETDGITVSPRGEIYVIQSGDTIVRVLPSTGDQVVLASGGLLDSSDIVLGPDGDLFLPSLVPCCAIFGSRSIVRVDRHTGVQAQVIPDFPVNGPGGTGLQLPVGIEVAPDGVTLLVLDLALGGSFGGVAQVDSTTGRLEIDFALILSGGPFILPSDFAVSPSGDIFVNYFNVATGRFEVVVFDAAGVFRGVLPTTEFVLIDVDAAGRLLGVAQAPDGRATVHRVDPATGAEILLASVPGPLSDITTVPPVPVAADAFIRPGAPNVNEGANPRLRIERARDNRALVGFDLSGLDRAAVSRATLVLTIAEEAANRGRDNRTVSAHPLRADFVEGNGMSAGVSDPDADRGSGPGVTWTCASDADVANGKPDCRRHWRGGAFGRATAPPVIHSNGQTGEVAWDVTADVRTGATGWLIKKATESASGEVTYYSREGAREVLNPALAPRLLLEWRRHPRCEAQVPPERKLPAGDELFRPARMPRCRPG